MNQHKSLSTIINKLQRKELLLHMEYNYEKETFKQQTEAMGIDRESETWHVLVSCQHRKKLLQLFKPTGYRGGRQEDKEIEHVFRIRRPVCFFTQDAPGNIHYFNFTATVNYVDEDRMVIVLPSADALLSIQQPSVSWGFNFILMKPVTD